ncbi:tail fiber domain-containing protein [Flavobacterium caeni]|uniref:Head domain of trimeric autotransporter adhesin n=1 Tax=Flavobacterium caeni TaxID=490189 RepID=A0A1G5I5B4_9FLAO|nr:tail fiber domain-containing protein [Flavobacterium caeni]SCY70518.1 Head domain of trimeric autotransporter adhesin [Flavobacterium caeni]
MRLHLLVLLFAIPVFAQVGVNTVSPQAQLDIRASNPAAPSNTDGILIPRINAFPTTNPTIAQHGMLVFMNNGFGTQLPGFYYWDNNPALWKPVTPFPSWGLSGNSGITSANFIGTTDLTDVRFRRGGILSGRLGETNTTFGFAALSNSGATGNFNTAIGAMALSNSTTGYENTAVGYAALQNNADGYYDSAFGRASMFENLSGESNAAYGYQSLRNNLAGNQNTAIGRQALLDNSSGSYNTAVGRRALDGNLTGNHNTAIGYFSDVAADGLTNATAVGNYAVAGASNTLVLGSVAGVNSATSNVNVGVGTTTPQTRLHVVGNLRLQDGSQAAGRILVSDANGTASWQVNSATNAWGLAGNAGTNPSINFIGTTTDADLVFRRNSVLSGRIGSNVSFGTNALATNGGNNNIALGTNALQTTIGARNIAIGTDALHENAGGTRNVAVGDRALLANVSGSFNSAFGESALAANSGGNENVAIGESALTANSVGYKNTALGSDSMSVNTTGGFNVGLGANTLQANSDGDRNVAVGYAAMVTNTTGSSNTVLGAAADVAAGALTNATAIGARAEAGASNSLVLGSINGVNSATADTNVGIGTTTPQERLHVVGKIRMVDGTQANGRIMTSNANGTASWTAVGTLASGTLDQAYDFGGAGLGRTITADAGALLINGTDGIVSTGTLDAGATIPAGDGSKFFWNPRKAAFRAGRCSAGEWDENNVGKFSVSFGNGNQASGDHSVALGNNGRASGMISTSMGFSNVAEGMGSLSWGRQSRATGNYSMGFGILNTAYTFGETVFGIGAANFTPSATGVTEFGPANGADRLFVIGNAIDSNNDGIVEQTERRNGFLMLKNGRTALGNITPGGQFQLSLDEGRKPGTNTWTVPSDERLKNIHGNYGKGLSEIVKLQPIVYHYKNVGEKTFEKQVLDTEYAGFSAQEVKNIFPEAVGVDDDGYLNLNIYSVLVASVNAFKELNDKKRALEKQLQAQEALLQKVLHRLSELESKK